VPGGEFRPQKGTEITNGQNKMEVTAEVKKKKKKKKPKPVEKQ